MFYEVRKTYRYFSDEAESVSVFFQIQKRAMEYRESLIENAKCSLTDPTISEDGEKTFIVSWEDGYEFVIEIIPRSFADPDQ